MENTLVQYATNSDTSAVLTYQINPPGGTHCYNDVTQIDFFLGSSFTERAIAVAVVGSVGGFVVGVVVGIVICVFTKKYHNFYCTVNAFFYE